jgi:hypothetical protein
MEEMGAVPLAVIAARCFAALGPAVATDVKSTIPVASARTMMFQRLMSASFTRSGWIR